MTTAFMFNTNTKYAKALPERITRQMRETQVPWGPVGYVVYKRTYARRLDAADPASPKEELWQSLSRCLNGLLDIGGAFTLRDLEIYAEYLINLKCMFSGRHLWQLGTPSVARLGGDSLQACWHIRVNEPIHPFTFAFDELMLGGGVGFNVMPENVYEIPPVRFSPDVKRVETHDCDYIVTDNREGYVGLLRRVLESHFFTGKQLHYNTSCIREKGKLIKSFGGTASGSEDLVLGINLIVQILQSRKGQKLRPIDCSDIMNIIGMIVKAGNVRRSAEIGCGSGRDKEFLLAKYWGDGAIIPKWRSQANNTVIESYLDNLLPEFWYGYQADEQGNAKGEPYGLFNHTLAANYGRLVDGERLGYNGRVCGPNPCVTLDTWVHTNNGPRQVVDLIDTPFVAISDGHEYRSSKAGFFHTGDKEVFQLKTSHGYSVKCTEDHEIYTPDRGKVALVELEPGDKIILMNHKAFPKWKGKGNHKEGWALGNLTGDGTFTEDSACLDFWGASKNVMIEFASDTLVEHFNHRKIAAERDTDNRLRISSVGLFRAAKEYVPASKILDERVEQTSSDFHCGFLQGWFDADGGVERDWKRGQGFSIRLHSSILSNLYIAQRMLSRLGIVSTVYKDRRKKGSRLLPNGQGGYSTYNCEAQHSLTITKENIITYSNRVGFIDPDKAIALKEAIANVEVSRKRKEHFTTTVKDIVPLGIMPVYDCQIYEAHNFDANGLKISNCGEICLESDEACNLGEIYLTNLANENEFHVAAELMYKALKTISGLPFIQPRTNEVVGRNRRLGLGVTGVMAAHHLRKPRIFDSVYKHIRETDKEYSKLLNAPESIAYTTVKPSGTLSKLANGCPPGGNPAYAQYHILRIEFSEDSPMIPTLRDAGYPIEPKLNLDGSRDFNSYMVNFPISYPEGTADERMSAIDQLENVKMLQTWWSDNAVSSTIQFRQEEMPAIRAWLEENYTDNLKSVAFCRHVGHGFKQPPNEPITKEQYEAFVKNVRPISSMANDGDDSAIEGIECSGGSCPVK